MKTGTIFAVTIVAISLSLASHGAALRMEAQGEKAEALGIVSPAVIRSLKKSVPREQLVAALLADARMKPVILEEGAKRGIAAGQIGTLATKPLPRTLSGDAVTAAAQMKAEEMDYAKIDWSAGIDMTPTGIPTYGSRRWKVATLTVRNATFTTSQPDALTISTDGNSTMSQVITCDLELPLEPAMYAVTIRLVRADGYLDSRWVTYEKAGHKPIQASWHDISKQRTWSGSQVELVTIPEINGYAAIIRADPVGSTQFENTGMRKVTSRFTLSFYPFAQLTTTPLDDQVFGGISIMRL